MATQTTFIVPRDPSPALSTCCKCQAVGEGEGWKGKGKSALCPVHAPKEAK